MAYGILGNYNPWVHHGESVNESGIVDKYEEDCSVIEVDSSSMIPLVFDTRDVRDSSTVEGSERDVIVCGNIGRGTSIHQRMCSCSLAGDHMLQLIPNVAHDILETSLLRTMILDLLRMHRELHSLIAKGEYNLHKRQELGQNGCYCKTGFI